ncbi:MAG: FAD:protein FMN transferase, partial [Nitrospirota bacterium]|nr:FAD:protein FMN transferase [Nitrospirota bacterium]
MTIGGPDPEKIPGQAVQKVLPLANRAMATSGDYRNFFNQKNQRFSHILDPKTGAPVRHPLASATVLAPTAMQADAAATTVMVLGPKNGL